MSLRETKTFFNLGGSAGSLGSPGKSLNILVVIVHDSYSSLSSKGNAETGKNDLELTKNVWSEKSKNGKCSATMNSFGLVTILPKLGI